jgi:hypothetical protein
LNNYHPKKKFLSSFFVQNLTFRMNFNVFLNLFDILF